MIGFTFFEFRKMFAKKVTQINLKKQDFFLFRVGEAGGVKMSKLGVIPNSYVSDWKAHLNETQTTPTIIKQSWSRLQRKQNWAPVVAK